MSGAVPPGRALADRYVIERELGRGGMGVVYLARDLRHDRAVAIKFLPAELAGALGDARFHQETQTLAKLTHPNILPLHDSGSADGQLYYVMPRIEGESLRDRLEREGPLPVTEALRIARSVADALAYAHARGVVHRDIKPANILLDRDSHAYVSDFGIARVLAGAENSRLTSGSHRLGSPAYMSPEQIAGEREVDGRSDVYGLGCVLYEMLAGTPPFADASGPVVLRRHLIDAPPSPRRLRADVGPAVDEITRGMLAKSPEDRPAAAATRDMLDIELARTTSERGLPRMRRAIARGPARRWLAAAVVLLAFVAVASLWPTIGASVRSTESGPLVTHIAILPFEDRSTEYELDALAHGLTDDLIEEFRQVPSLRVISSAGVASFRPGAVSLDSVARALGVGTVVTGSITRSGDRLRANVQIVDPQTGLLLGDVDVERAWDDLLELRDSLVADVAFALRQALGRDVRLVRQEGTRNAEAWQAVQEARESYESFRDLTTAGDRTAAAAFAKRADSALVLARTLDPSWVDVLLERGWLARALAITSGGDLDAERVHIAAARAYADSAVALEPESSRALTLRGSVALYQALGGTGMHALLRAARIDLERAVELDHTLARAWSDLSAVYQSEGRLTEAAHAAERAYAEDNYLENASEILYRLFLTHHALGDRSKAERWCDELARRPVSALPTAMCRLVLLASGAGSRAAVDQAWSVHRHGLRAPDDPEIHIEPVFDMLTAIVIARAGLADSARAVAARARGDSGDAGLLVLEAEMLTALGAHDEAVVLLARVLRENSAYEDIIPWNRRFAALAQNSSYQELRRQFAHVRGI